MKRILLWGAVVSLVACGGDNTDSTSSSSSSSGGSSSSSSSSSGDISSGGLTDVLWHLRFMENELGVRQASDVPMTLRFDEDLHMEGTTSCGPFVSTYRFRHDAISFTDAPNLPFACPPSPWSPLEQNYYAALNSIVRFSVDDARLTLLTENNMRLIYETTDSKCATPTMIAGEKTTDLPSISVSLTSDQPTDVLIQRLRADYPDLQIGCSTSDSQIQVSVNPVTLQYLRCRSDITTISY